MFDLYLGSDLGLWALQQVPSSIIGKVFTFDNKIAELSQSREQQCMILFYIIVLDW